MAGPGYSPFIKIAGSDTIYDAPIVATGDGPFDVTHHSNTGDRVLGVHIAGPDKPGQFNESWVDMLFVKICVGCAEHPARSLLVGYGRSMILPVVYRTTRRRFSALAVAGRH